MSVLCARGQSSCERAEEAPASSSRPCEQTPEFKGLLPLRSILMCLSHKYVNRSRQDWGCSGTSLVLKLLHSSAW